MEDERRERHSTSGIALLIGLIIGLAVGYIVGIKGYIRAENGDETPQEIVSETVTDATEPANDESLTRKTSVSVVANTTKKKATSKSAISQEEGTRSTSTASRQTRERNTASSTSTKSGYTQQTTAPAAPTVASQTTETGTDENAVTLASYSHDWVQPNAQVSLKNNTDRDIVSITGRMIYYDMSGNMLDYQDFTERIHIDAGMTKRFALQGYNYAENYAYYKSEVMSSANYKKYKVKFQLKSYKTAPKSENESMNVVQAPHTSTNEKGVSMTAYSHDWVQPNAQVSLKNNTNKDIVSVTGRMIYYDMQGRMLDYQDFTKRVDIEAGMTKRFDLRGYNYEENYAYYKSEVMSSASYKKYNVKFQLKSFTYK